MVKSYEVAGHLFRIEADSESSLWNKIETNYGPFGTSESGRPIFSLSVCENFSIIDKLPVFSNKESIEEGFPVIEIYRSKDGHYFEFTHPTAENATCKLLINHALDQAKVYLGGNGHELFYIFNTAVNFCFMSAAANIGTVLVHSSAIIYKGMAYMFLGKSGTGKSTHSRMWLNAISGTELLNDDHPIIRIDKNGQAIAYGSPWSGKTPCYKNIKAPVGAIVRISRAEHNRARKLSPVESYASIMPSCPNLIWEKQLANGKHSTLQKIIETVPCWVMECLPNEDAAKVCCSAVASDL